jgi:cell division protein FtsB
MNELLILVIGYGIGALSVTIAYVVQSSRKQDELEDEIHRLRVTRQMLKEEIFRLEKNYKPTKPTPRKYRKQKNL